VSQVRHYQCQCKAGECHWLRLQPRRQCADEIANDEPPVVQHRTVPPRGVLSPDYLRLSIAQAPGASSPCARRSHRAIGTSASASFQWRRVVNALLHNGSSKMGLVRHLFGKSLAQTAAAISTSEPTPGSTSAPTSEATPRSTPASTSAPESSEAPIYVVHD